jgi:metal-sulfur cluster biosynthetic enzyme
VSPAAAHAPPSPSAGAVGSGDPRPTEAGVLAALRGVLDPELDEPVVELGFVRRVEVASGPAGARVRVVLRLPTYWCAPNFSWLMAADAREALLAHPGIAEAEVVLDDHHASSEISAGVNGGRSFAEVFEGEATGELGDLRDLFRRKAFMVRQERLVQSLRGGAPAAQRALTELTIGELPDSEEARAYLAVRAELGLDCSPAAPVMTDPGGRPVRDLERHLQRARLMRVAMRGNGAFCRGLLATRYREEGGAK